MTEASLCKIAHPGLQRKIINRLSLLPSSKEPTAGRVTVPTPPTLKRLKRDRLMHPTAEGGWRADVGKHGAVNPAGRARGRNLDMTR